MKKKEIVKKLLLLQKECMQKEDKFSSVGLEINLMSDFELWNIALDLIGFPEEKEPPVEFFNELNISSTEDIDKVLDSLGKEGYFCRDWLYDHPFMDTEKEASVDDYIDWLFLKLSKLNLEDPATIEVSRFTKEQLN